jgi:hypothetical protein
MIKSFRFGRALVAGLLGTAAMTALMYGWPLLGLPRMDIVAALGGVFPFNLSPYVLGSLVHLGIGVSLALIYALFFDPWLPGPGWLRGALFSFIPWLFAITLLGPSLLVASEVFKGKEAIAANPCSVSNPCVVRPANPCSVNQPKSNPCAPKASNPCAAKANPCAVANPCGAGSTSSSGPSPQAMSLIVHLLFGVVLGVTYRPSGT